MCKDVFVSPSLFNVFHHRFSSRKKLDETQQTTDLLLKASNVADLKVRRFRFSPSSRSFFFSFAVETIRNLFDKSDGQSGRNVGTADQTGSMDSIHGVPSALSSDLVSLVDLRFDPFAPSISIRQIAFVETLR